MKNSLYLVWISFKLAFSLVQTWIQLLWLKTRFGLKILLCFTFIAVSATVLIVHTATVEDETEIITVAPPHKATTFTKTTVTKPQLEAKRLTLELLLQQQPRHRDILINLALVYKSLGNEFEYEKYWNQAKEIDPNNSIFQ